MGFSAFCTLRERSLSPYFLGLSQSKRQVSFRNSLLYTHTTAHSLTLLFVYTIVCPPICLSCSLPSQQQLLIVMPVVAFLWHRILQTSLTSPFSHLLACVPLLLPRRMHMYLLIVLVVCLSVCLSFCLPVCTFKC